MQSSKAIGKWYQENVPPAAFKEKKVYQKIIKARKRVVETNFHKNLLTSHNQNPRDFWKTVNHLREKDKHIETGVNPKKLLSHLQNLNMKRSGNEPPNASRVCVPHLDREISVAEVEEVLRKLKVNKAPGEDGIPPGVFKALDNTLIEMLAILFNDLENTQTVGPQVLYAHYINQVQEMTRTTTEG